ncbi:hypothetical protein Kisp01_27580 [Kineosporia sp. NBRC 101677]|nr:hypothetical protein Kisp01_27580 [Kineosporia sp. NBRC 101677]
MGPLNGDSVLARLGRFFRPLQPVHLGHGPIANDQRPCLQCGTPIPRAPWHWWWDRQDCCSERCWATWASKVGFDQ